MVLYPFVDGSPSDIDHESDASRVDALGRLVVPKVLRDALGLTPGSVVDVSRYGDGLRLVPGGRTARLVESDDGAVLAESDTVITDEMVFDLIDAGRR